MKTTLLFLSVFLTKSLFCQNVYIPDANFKAYLASNPDINTNGDTEIQISEAEAYSGTIYCGNANISDLTGIEAFTSITELYCPGNNLTSLDLSQNISLYWAVRCNENQLTSLILPENSTIILLNCQNNQLTNLNTSGATILNTLLCQNNELVSLDLSQNVSLTTLSCHNNNLQCINVANGYNSFLNSFYSYNNPELMCVQVDDAAWSTANWTYIDPQTSFSEDCDYPSDCFTASVDELSTSKNLFQILDLMGRETTFKPNTLLIYVYDDGSTEKVFTIE